MAWTLADIRTRWRALTGRSSVSDIADATVNSRINDYIQYHLPLEIEFDALETDWTQETTVTDSGEYTLGQAQINLNEPITAKGPSGIINLVIYHDKIKFFEAYPQDNDEDYITSPTLVIGTTPFTKVKNSAFKYLISGWIYAKISTETLLSGNTVPQNKYGAWLLEIDSAGTITVTEADDNITGYATAALAVNGLPAADSNSAVMGYVTAINTATGGFVPGTTLLNAATVTATYTDGEPTLRNIPSAICIAGGKLFIRPKVNDTYLIRAKLSVARPSSLADDTASLTDDILGALVASGSAIWYLAEIGEDERVREIRGSEDAPGSFLYLLKMAERKKLLQHTDQESYRSF